jgi:hypothetical protein
LRWELSYFPLNLQRDFTLMNYKCIIILTSGHFMCIIPNSKFFWIPCTWNLSYINT